MRLDPILGRTLCAAAIAAVLMPVGAFVFALLPGWVGHLPFAVFEAAVSATLGFGIFSALSG
jgi:hypothetical protein